MSCTSNTSFCSTCDTNSCTCGCPIQLSSKCIIYKSDALSCLEIQAGTPLEDILKTIDTAFCNITPSGVLSYEVVSADSTHITVVPTQAGTVVTFTLDLAAAFVTRLSNAETNINSIYDILADLPITITTDTPLDIAITHPSVNTWKVNYIGSPTPFLGGVIHSNCTQAIRPVTTTNATTKNFLTNYLTAYSLASGDMIKVRATFQSPTTTDLGANSTTSVSLSSFLTISTLDNTVLPPSNAPTVSYYYDIEINVISTGYPTSVGVYNALVTAKVYKTQGNTGTRYYPENTTSASETLVAHSLSEYKSINWANLDIICKQTGSTVSVSAKNDLFRVELVKKI